MKYDYDALSKLLDTNDGQMELVRINYATVCVTNVKNRMLCNLQVYVSKDKIGMCESGKKEKRSYGDLLEQIECFAGANIFAKHVIQKPEVKRCLDIAVLILGTWMC